MTRSQRLLDVIQLLREHQAPVSAETIADRFGITVRTVYRDIATLRAQGATIETVPGVGFRLAPGYLLPPLMFTGDELEALLLGTHWVASHTDDALGRAAASAIGRIGAVLPADLRNDLDASTRSYFAPNPAGQVVDPTLRRLREAIRTEVKVRITYRRVPDEVTERTVWPIALGFFEQASRVVVGWCELRQDFRHFRTDRIEHLTMTGEPFPRSRADLQTAWHRQKGFPPPDV